MSVLKYKDPVTGEVKTVGMPDAVYTKEEIDEMFEETISYGKADLTANVSPLETGKLYFVYE